MIRRPPISPRTHPLFPYTPLFRSVARTQVPPCSAAPMPHCGVHLLQRSLPLAASTGLALARRGYSPLSPRHPRKPNPPGAVHVERRSEEHTSELQSLMRISYAVFCLKKKQNTLNNAPYTPRQ